jgi:hypothetical protein
VYLAEGDVALVTKNSNDDITSMIIKDVTGDTAIYGILEEINENEKDYSESYTCIVDGNSKNYSNKHRYEKDSSLNHNSAHRSPQLRTRQKP